MSESISRRTKIIAGAALAIGSLTANACAFGETRENTFNIAITCPESTDLDVIEINNKKSVGDDEVMITCRDSETSETAPTDIQIIEGSDGAIIGDQQITDTLLVTTRTYGGGKGRFGNSQIDPSGKFATLSFDVANIKGVSVDSTPNAEQTTSTEG